MLKNLNKKFRSLFPTRIDEEFSLDKKNYLELLFIKIIKGIKGRFRVKVYDDSGSTLTGFFTDILIIFILLWLFTFFLFLFPYFLVNPEDITIIVAIFQYSIFILFCSISWAGYVYLNQDFRELIKIKLLPVIIDNPNTPRGYKDFLRQYFNGIYYEWRPGVGIRLYFKSILSVVCK